MARPPRVRNAVNELVIKSSRLDWSIDEIRSDLARRGTDADFSSVYRSVEALVDSGSLRRVQLGRSESRFERADSPHDHVRCDHCGTVAAVERVAVELPLGAVGRETGFTVSGHEIIFHGLCSACAAARG